MTDELATIVALFDKLLPEDRGLLMSELQDRLCPACGDEYPKYGPCPSCGSLREEERPNPPTPSEAEHLLGELLAVIHCDGGHHTARHGVAKSVADAQTRVLQDRCTDDLVPRNTLIARARDLLTRVRERPHMYGGSWQGVECFILDQLDQLDYALSWPHPQLGLIGVRWNYACGKVHRSSNGGLCSTLAYDNVTDEEAIHAKYKAAMDEYLSCDGLCAYWIKHGECGGCHAHGFGSKHTESHCSSGCPMWPCPHADGDAEVLRWRAIYDRVSP